MRCNRLPHHSRQLQTGHLLLLLTHSFSMSCDSGLDSGLGEMKAAGESELDLTDTSHLEDEHQEEKDIYR